MEEMSFSSSESEHPDHDNDSQGTFVSILKKYRVLFNKSQLPKVKDEKEKALLEVMAEYQKQLGKMISEKQLRKKIQNMKTEIKKKTDKTATGNRKIILKGWEEDFLHLLSAEQNPVFNKVPGMLHFISLLLSFFKHYKKTYVKSNGNVFVSDYCLRI